MSYLVKTTYPKEETMELAEAKYTTTKKQEVKSEVELPDVIDMYNSYQRQGYTISVGFVAPLESEDDDSTPFDVAERLTENGIDYKATLKIKNSGTYEDIIQIAHIIEQHGFDLAMNIKLTISEDSTVNIDDESTWMSADDAVFKVTPKAASTNIGDLRGLYDDLSDYDVTIDIKPKAQSGDDDDFATQLEAYPDQTEITFTLKDAEY